MATEFHNAEMIRKAEVYQNEAAPALGVLRLETASGNSFFLVTKETLLTLSTELSKAANSLL